MYAEYTNILFKYFVVSWTCLLVASVIDVRQVLVKCCFALSREVRTAAGGVPNGSRSLIANETAAFQGRIIFRDFLHAILAVVPANSIINKPLNSSSALSKLLLTLVITATGMKNEKVRLTQQLIQSNLRKKNPFWGTITVSSVSWPSTPVRWRTTSEMLKWVVKR